MRLDKYLANMWVVPRRQIKRLLKTWAVLLDWEIVGSPALKINAWQVLTIYDQEIEVKFLVTILLHKPAWYISSDVDEGEYSSYNDLIYECPYSQLMHVAGRLDVDTEWLLLCTSDGKLTQSIVHPKNNCEKEYFVRTALPVNERMIEMLEAWVMMDGYKQALPWKVTLHTENEMSLVITEGKFHQVKRMLRAVGNEVVYLRRDRIGEWTLWDLQVGEWMYIETWYNV